MKRPWVRRARIGHVPIDRLTFVEALAAIRSLVEQRRGGKVFTPNVDHVVMASDDARFRLAYADVDLSLADGMPVVWATQLLGVPVPEKISGSDLVPRLMTVAEDEGFRVYLFGGADGVAARAADELRRTHPRLVIAGTSSAHVDLDRHPRERRHIVDAIAATRPDLVLVALGAPKQELWIDEVFPALRPAVLLGVGASIDFLAGTAVRAPTWMSAVGLEWAYRLASEPTRLWRRYLIRDPRFLGIVRGDWKIGQISPEQAYLRGDDAPRAVVRGRGEEHVA